MTKNSILTQFDLKCYHMNGRGYTEVHRFLDEQRMCLKRIEFFYPYTEEELKSVIDGGHFIALKDHDEIVATVAVDLDKEYATKLAKIIETCTLKSIKPTYAFEVSGLMVKENYRGKGLANYLVNEALKEAQGNCEWVCSVVQIENVASMSVFLKNGFVLAGVYQMGGEYDFAYFIRKVDCKFAYKEIVTSVQFRDIEKHKQCLKNKMVGVKVDNNCIYYAEY